MTRNPKDELGFNEKKVHQGIGRPGPELALLTAPRRRSTSTIRHRRSRKNRVRAAVSLPVQTPHIEKLPFTEVNGVKVFHLTAGVAPARITSRFADGAGAHDECLGL